ncbi:hypothetical protein GEMRC1_002684 [Eukaryota sp. GEM-RC1]
MSLADLREAFNLFDKDSNGVIELDELKEVMISLGMNPSHDELNSMMQAVDLDSNGVIDFDEFCCLMNAAIETSEPDDELYDAFLSFDKNSDGKIEIGELKSMMDAIGTDMTDKELRDMFSAADTNSDGYIDFEEFKKILTN